MSRTYKQKKYLTHRNNLSKDYKGIEKLCNCPYGLGCCGDKFGERHTKNAKIRRRRYLRHCAKQNHDLVERLMEFYEADDFIRVIKAGSESWRDIGQTLYGKALPPSGLIIVGVVIMNDMEGGALLLDPESGVYFMGSDGELIRELGRLEEYWEHLHIL